MSLDYLSYHAYRAYLLVTCGDRAPTGAFYLGVFIFNSIMFASHVSPHFCPLFTVMCTDLENWKTYEVTLLRTNFKDASRWALEYQANIDPSRKSFDFRVHQCG